MTRASALDAAARSMPATALTTEPAPRSRADADRRLTDSNQAWLGKIVDGRYRVLEVIGRGGMGVVYRVEHLRMGKIAAMKVLHRDLASDPEVVAAVRARGRRGLEAAPPAHRAGVRLRHRAGRAVPDHGVRARARPRAHHRARRPDAVVARGAAARADLRRAAGGARARHRPSRSQARERADHAHRPAAATTRRCSTSGSRSSSSARAPTTETDRQQIVGTPYFMSPEQIRGDDVDARTDIYSFGALMFELLTGQHLFTGSTAVGVLTKHLTAEPDAPSMRAPKMGIDPRVDHLCRKALAKDPSERWQTAAELARGDRGGLRRDRRRRDRARRATRRRARSPAARLVARATTTTSDLRLRRSDIDAFERGLKRRRVSCSLARRRCSCSAASAPAAWCVTREPPPLHEEREPNDDAAHANKIAAGTPITGYLGKRRSRERGRSRHVRRAVAGGQPARRHRARHRRCRTSTSTSRSPTATACTARPPTRAASARARSLHRRAIDGPLVDHRRPDARARTRSARSRTSAIRTR